MKSVKPERKKKREYKGKSIYTKACIPVLVVIVIQLVVAYALVMMSGSMDKVRSEDYGRLTSRVQNRADAIETMLVDKRDAVGHYKERIEEEVADVLAAKNKTMQDLYRDSALNEEVMKAVAGEIEELLCSSRSSGSFLVLQGYGTDSELKYGLYLRNSKPGSTEERYMSVLRGTETMLDYVMLPADENWRSEFRITQAEENDFYNRIYELTDDDAKYSSLALGYWTPVYSMYGDEEEIITYTIPLTDSTGDFYGVLGIEVSKQQLLEQLPYKELSSDGASSYYLVYREDASGDYKTMIASANSNKDITDKDGYITYADYDAQENMYEMNTSLDGTYIGTVSNMELYTTQSPFTSNQWAVAGVENENDLLQTYDKLKEGQFLTLAFVLVLEIFAAWYLCYRFGSYVRNMTLGIRSSSPKETLELARVDVKDINELAEAIQELDERGTSSAKLVEIIDMAGIPVGAIEYREAENFVFCTQSAAQILEFHHVDRESQYISRKAFDIEIEVLRKNLTRYEEEDDTYCMVSRTGADKWVRLKVKERDDRILMAVLDVTSEIMEKQKIEYERDYDILTRLLNRNAFRARMGQMLKRGNLGIAAVVMMDLDNLKYFNDTYGHDYGDKYIREAAVVLSTLNQHNALVARMSGDEFLMFISGYSNKDEIRSLVYDVHSRLQESYVTVPGGENIRIRASAGIAWYPEDATYLDELIKYADFAMYEIKSSKKGGIREFNREMYLKDSVLFTGKEELNRLLEDPEMVRYVFQPIVEVVSGEIFGYEALMRPRIESLRSPEDVMRLAKAQSKLYQVEKMTWMSALEAVERQRSHGDKFRIFINSVPNHVLEDGDTQELEKKYRHILDRVIIEIIESEQTDRSCMETKCEWAKKHGASIALDDFGTGYSNESTLLYIDPKYVKIDMSIISNIHKDEGRQKIVQGLLTYTKSHGIKVIAEGIDCYEEMRTLVRLGVDYMQGWYLSRGSEEIMDIPSELKTQIRECVYEVEHEDE